MKELEPGQQIETVIVAVTDDTIFLDLNTKTEGVLNTAEFADDEGNISVKEGDKIKVYFVGYQGGEMRFTTKISGENAVDEMLENAFKNHIPVEGVVDKEIKGGYEVKIGAARAFCPYSQMGFRQKEAPDAYVGRHLTFMITKFEEKGRNLMVSNRVIGEAAWQQQLEALKSKWNVGDKIHGVIESLQNYGAFVDIGGFRALLPVSEISRTRVTKVEDVLSVGQEIDAVIIKLDWQNERVSLSMKELEADPWDEMADKFPAGTKIEGKISRVADFGVFVELEKGIDGLLHVSEMKNVERSTNLRKVYKPGDTLAVVVKGVDAAGHRISLIPGTLSEEEQTTQEYFSQQKDDDGTDTYNPFAALLKKK